MSSYTRMHFRVRATKEQAINIDSILGPGGRKMLLDTMKSLTEGNAEQNLRHLTQGSLAWRRDLDSAAGRDTYTLELSGETLGDLRPAGVEHVNVRLEIGATLATVTQQVCSHGSSRSVSQVAQKQVQRIANQAVNRVLALTTAQQLTQRVAERIKQEVGLTVEQNGILRVRANVTGGVL